jgi:lysosomal acid lipase/cholesteryl ester hydrolase
MQLFKRLPNPVGAFRVPLRQFNHLDFLWGKDAKTLVYDKILELMSKW